MGMKPFIPEGSRTSLMLRPRRLVLLFSLLIFVFSGAFAQDRVIDNAGLLNPAEKARLMEMTASVAAVYNFDLVIVTEKNIGGQKPMDYADDFFDYNGYGLGEDHDGCLFLQVTGSRDYWFSTSGRGIKILNSSAFGKLEADVLKYHKDGYYYEAYRTFILVWEEFLSLEANGKSYNFFRRWNLVLVSGAWVFALMLGFVIVSFWKKSMNTALPKIQAAAYAVPGSLAFREKKDRFLYSTITKTKRQQSSGSGSHRGSSGRSHGGGGGKY